MLSMKDFEVLEDFDETIEKVSHRSSGERK